MYKILEYVVMIGDLAEKEHFFREKIHNCNLAILVFVSVRYAIHIDIQQKQALVSTASSFRDIRFPARETLYLDGVYLCERRIVYRIELSTHVPAPLAITTNDGATEMQTSVPSTTISTIDSCFSCTFVSNPSIIENQTLGTYIQAHVVT